MPRKTWKKGNLYLSFGKPDITAFRDNIKITSMKDAMYFYYDLTILQDNKTLFEASAYDFPKVQNLPLYIDNILNFDSEKMYVLEDYHQGDFERKVKYHHEILQDIFGFDIEYFYKLERYDYFIKNGINMDGQSFKEKNWSEFILTIGKMEISKEYGGDNREDYGKCIMIKCLTPDDLNRLKMTAVEFCNESIREHNQFIENK